jgi:hypothetical protein
MFKFYVLSLVSLSLVSALPNDFLSTFHSSTTCDNGLDDTTSSIIAPQQLCQSTGHGKSYAVFCSPDSNNGTAVYCEDSQCSVGCVDAPFLSGQCLVGSFGASAQSFTCLSTSSTIVAEPGCDRCQVSYHADKACRLGLSLSRSIVDVPLGLCQVDSPTTSWLVTGNETHSNIAFCSDANCGTCDTRIVTSNECFLNGNSNLRIQCGKECTDSSDEKTFPSLELPILGSFPPSLSFTDLELERMPFDFKATFFSSGTCSSTDSQSTIIAQQNFCQQSGGKSYQVFCDDNLNLNNGTVIFYSDQLCSLDANKVFFENGQCLASASSNDIGATGIAWQCLKTKNTKVAPPTNGRCAVSFFELDGCKGNDRSIVDVVSGICQVDGERSWMIMRNDTDSTAVIAWCDDSMCSQCPLTSVIARDQCIGSNGDGPSGPGSRGVRAICSSNSLPPLTVTPTLLPKPTTTSKPLTDPYAIRPPRRPTSSPSPAPVVRGPVIDPYAVRPPPRRPSMSPSAAPIVRGPVVVDPYKGLFENKLVVDPYNMIPRRKPSMSSSPVVMPSIMPAVPTINVAQPRPVDQYAVRPTRRPSMSPSPAPVVRGPVTDPYAVRPPPRRPSTSPSAAPILSQPRPVDPYNTKPVNVAQPRPVDPYNTKPVNVAQPRPVDPYNTKPVNVAQPRPVDPYNTKPVNVAQPRPVDPYNTKPVNVAQPRPVDPYNTKPVNVAQPRPVDPYNTKPVNVAQPRPVDPYNTKPVNVAQPRPVDPYNTKPVNVAQPRPVDPYNTKPVNVAQPRPVDPYNNMPLLSQPRPIDYSQFGSDLRRYDDIYERNNDISLDNYYGFVYPDYRMPQFNRMKQY